MQFTVPVAIAREQVVTRIDDDTIESIDDLIGRRIAIRPSSSFRATVDELLQAYPGIEIEDVPERFDTEEIIRRVASGDYDLTVADSNLVQAMKAGGFGLRHGMILILFPEGERSIDGSVKTFKKGAAVLSLHLGAPIVPIALEGIYELWPRNRPPRNR